MLQTWDWGLRRQLPMKAIRQLTRLWNWASVKMRADKRRCLFFCSVSRASPLMWRIHHRASNISYSAARLLTAELIWALITLIGGMLMKASKRAAWDAAFIPPQFHTDTRAGKQPAVWPRQDPEPRAQERRTERQTVYTWPVCKWLYRQPLQHNKPWQGYQNKHPSNTTNTR